MTIPVECAAVVKADGYGLGWRPSQRDSPRPAARPSSSLISAKDDAVRALAPGATIYVLTACYPTPARRWRKQTCVR